MVDTERESRSYLGGHLPAFVCRRVDVSSAIQTLRYGRTSATAVPRGPRSCGCYRHDLPQGFLRTIPPAPRCRREHTIFFNAAQPVRRRINGQPCNAQCALPSRGKHTRTTELEQIPPTLGRLIIRRICNTLARELPTKKKRALPRIEHLIDVWSRINLIRCEYPWSRLLCSMATMPLTIPVRILYRILPCLLLYVFKHGYEPMRRESRCCCTFILYSTLT